MAALERWSQHHRATKREREEAWRVETARDGAWRSVAWRVARLGAAWRGVARFYLAPWRAVHSPCYIVFHVSLSLSLRNAFVAALRCVVALCRQSVAVAAPVRWDCAIGRVSKIEI